MSFDLRQLLAAPELLVIDLVDASLDTLLRALLVEHPSLSAPSPFRESDLCRRARALVRCSQHLRREIVAYRHAVDRALDDEHDLPF